MSPPQALAEGTGATARGAPAPQRPSDPPTAAPAPVPAEAPVLVRAEGLGKCYRIYKRPLDRLLEWTGGGQRHKPFWAVRNVSFQVRRGECLGIIGANGSGKSTILKMLAGALWPTEGAAECQGRVLSLIELGTGLNPQLTGRANIGNIASLLNFPPDYAREAMDEIEAFAELEEFFDRPVMLYSSGMRVRLAFSMFACFRPEVFLIDEALSVGDVFFQQKCAARLREMLAAGLTMVFVSHDQGAVLNLCDRVILLSRGKAVFQGPPEEAMSRYYSILNPAPGGRWGQGRKPTTAPAAPIPHPQSQTPNPADPAAAIIKRDIVRSRAEHRHGTGRLKIVAARVTTVRGLDTLRAAVGETLTFHVLIEATEGEESPRAGIRFFDRLGNLVFGCGTHQLGLPLPPMAPGERRIVRFEVTMDVQPDAFTFGLGCGGPGGEGPDAGTAHDRIDLLGPITVYQKPGEPRPFFGIARLPLRASSEPVLQEPPA